tara:strand:+ start:539 stop:1009 length:471 start_codon:yes stop_codon:yes gene_type:complete
MKRFKTKNRKKLVLSGVRRYLLMLGMNLLPFSFLRIKLLRFCGLTIGNGNYIGFNFSPDTNYPSLIKIGNNVTISHNVCFYTHTATPVISYLSEKYNESKQIVIKDGAWIGAGSIILPGSVIEENCFIGAGSVLRGYTQKYSLYAGNPCRRIKSLN